MWSRLKAPPVRLRWPALAAAVLAVLGAGISAFVFAGCSSGGTELAPTPTPGQSTAPTSAPADNGGTPPAEGYRLVPSVPSAQWDNMLGFYMFPNSSDEAAVVQQTGAIWRVSLSDAFAPELFGDLSGRLIADRGREEGLLGQAFSPEFQSDGRVYVYYSAGDPRRTVLSRFAVRDGAMDMGSERVILEVEQPYANHNGGQIAFGPDGYLYVALGDGGSGGDPHGNAQDLDVLLGSILRLDVSGEGYAVPGDNPFAGRAGRRGEIWAYGLRNPWRFSFDRATGDLWAGDVGQGEWEEVDRVVRGGNYGWNIMEGFECYGADQCDGADLRMPRAAYSHAEGCSVTGGFVYRGGQMPELAGWYVYGDFCSGNIWAVNPGDDSEPVILARTDLPIATFGELPNGEIVAVTFANGIFRLTRS